MLRLNLVEELVETSNTHRPSLSQQRERWRRERKRWTRGERWRGER